MWFLYIGESLKDEIDVKYYKEDRKCFSFVAFLYFRRIGVVQERIESLRVCKVGCMICYRWSLCCSNSICECGFFIGWVL